MVRYNTKSNPCQTCGGPYGDRCSKPDYMEEFDRNRSEETGVLNNPTCENSEKGIFADVPIAHGSSEDHGTEFVVYPMSSGDEDELCTEEGEAPTTAPTELAQKMIRFCIKRKGCENCGGPCAGSCGPSSNDAAETFSRIITEMKRRRTEATEARDVTTTAAAARGQQASSSHSGHVQEPRKGSAKGPRRKTTAPANFGRVPPWLATNPSVGGVKIHDTHLSHLAWHRGIIWCWRCGVYATRVPINLKGTCDGPTEAGQKALSLLRQGKPPNCKVDWPLPES